MKVIVVNAEACFYVEFIIVNACLTFIWIYWILLLDISFATFQFHQPTYHLFLFQLDIFILTLNRYQHIWLSFLIVSCITVGRFYAFFTWLIDGLIFAFNNCDIFMLVIEFGLNSFHNCIIVFHNLLALFLMFLFTKINVLFILPETLQRNWPFLISLICDN